MIALRQFVRIARTHVVGVEGQVVETVLITAQTVGVS